MQKARVDTIRRFNRFYTARIGALHEGLLDSAFTLTESRLLWELAHCDRPTAAELARRLDLDPGYLSRLVAGFKARGLLKTTRSTADARQQHLSLTAAGRRAFAPLDIRSQAEAGDLLAPLDDAEQRELIDSMARIERLLDGGAAPRAAAAAAAAAAAVPAAAIALRPHRAGDLGWIVSRHGVLYAAEYAWDLRFEALVAHIAADFIERFEPAREACWIAERDGENVGSIVLVQARDEATQAPLDGAAQLRLLLVEPAARGLGLGVRLVDECRRFARRAGYRRIVLWTNASLLAARAIYRRAGYRLLQSEPHHSFGHDLIGERWELRL